MIAITWFTALRLFVSLWTRALHLSARLSPTNWDRVVIVCCCLLVVSIFWMLSATPSAKVETPVELSNTQQRPESENRQPLQEMAQQSASDPSYSDRSNAKRALRKLPTKHKTNYRISEGSQRVTVHVRGDVPDPSVKPSELNVAGGESGIGIAAEAALKEKVQTTRAETANNIPLVGNPTSDEIKPPLEQFEPQIDLLYVDSGVKPVYQSAPTQPPLWVKKPWAASAHWQYGSMEKPEDTDTDGLPDSNTTKDDTGAQTWDILGNEALYVRDVTSGSCMAFASVLFARTRSIEISPDANKNTIQVNLACVPEGGFFHSQHTIYGDAEWTFSSMNGLPGRVRTLSDVPGQHSHWVKFDMSTSDDSVTGFNYEDGVFFGENIYARGTLRTVFTHDHACINERNSSTPLLRAYPNDKAQIRPLVGAHEFRQSFGPWLVNPNADVAYLNAGMTWQTVPLTSPELLTSPNQLVPDRRSNSQHRLDVEQPLVAKHIHVGPTEHGVNTETEELKIQPRGQEQRSKTKFAALAAPWDLPKPVVPPADKSAILFWIFLLNMLMNTLSTTSAIILAWISNNRAKAELILKEAQARRDEAQALREQAQALREAKEKDLKIKELELRLTEFERRTNPALIIVSS